MFDYRGIVFSGVRMLGGCENLATDGGTGVWSPLNIRTVLVSLVVWWVGRGEGGRVVVQ